MQATIKTVNATGLKEIAEFLGNKHKLGGDHFTDDIIRAWAQDAEFQLGEGNQASIEIRAFDSISGHTENYTITDAGLDSEIVEIEE